MSYICEWKSTGGLPKGNFHPLFQEADSLKPTYQRVCREGKVKKEREKKDISYPFHDTEADKSTLPPKILLTASTIPQSAPPLFYHAVPADSHLSTSPSLCHRADPLRRRRQICFDPTPDTF